MAVGAHGIAAASILLPPWVYNLVVGLLVCATVVSVAWAIGRTWNVRHQLGESQHDMLDFDLHRLAKPYAESVKIVLQMFIGGGLGAVILLKLLDHLGLGFAVPFLNDQVYGRPTLEIVGLALAYSSALELAYALFTRGPDEAVEPLIMGVAAAILIVVSGISPIDLVRATGVALLVLALAGLFVIRQFFILPGGWRWGGRTAELPGASGSEHPRSTRVVEDGEELPI